LQLPSGYPRKPSSCCTYQKHLKKGAVCWIWDLKLKRGNQTRMKILPPINASKLMQHSRSALQRVVMSRRLCSRCRMRRRSWWLVLCSGVALSFQRRNRRGCTGEPL
jgi:hypothetical protein